MISFEQAYKIIMDSVFSTGSEMIPFHEALGRVLAEDIFSDTDMPPFNRSAVDGFACRKADLKNDLDIIEVIPAGREPIKEVMGNQCSRIMTGAIVPEGCDIVIMVEDTIDLNDGKIRFTGSGLKSNIAYKGEDVREGDLVIEKGKIITSADIAVMASAGRTSVRTARKPEVGIISTGDELVEPGTKPNRSQIRNSNAYQLLSQVDHAGARGNYYGIVPDDDTASEIIGKSVLENDIVILTGGVSMGDYDFVPSFLEKAGVRILFDRVNVQPGKPTTFGIHARSLVFGLPGNPVSSFVQFETLVRPLLLSMMGSSEMPSYRKVQMGTFFERKSASRTGWVPVTINGQNEAFPVEYHGSAHITAISRSNGIIMVLPGVNRIDKGETVLFMPF